MTEILKDHPTNTTQASDTVDLSIVIPCHNEISVLPTLRERLVAAMDGLGLSWECILIDDGSRDASLNAMIAIHEADKRFVVLELSRNFGKEVALTAGLDYARGRAAIPLDADLQDPPEVIPELVKKWKEGFDIVNAVRSQRDGESFVKKATAHAFYRVINKMSRVKIPYDTGDFRLISRPALEALKRLPERRRFMKGLFAWVGFRTATVTYRRDARHSGTTTWNYWKLWNFALEGIISFSQVPLQLASYVGFFVAFGSFLYGMWILIHTLAHGNPVPGYPSLMVTILFLGGAQLMAIGVVGEYIARIHDEAKGRPIYLIRQTWIDKTD
jgi:glycosyltransferase involved in cell wall biosynthesis